MIIWQVGAAASPNRVDGVNATVWRLAVEQARAHHTVTLLVGRQIDPTGAALAAKAGLRTRSLREGVLGFDPRALRDLLDREPPDVVHMHSVFIPSHALLARELRRRRIPYVVTPHAGLAPEILARRPIRKRLYGILLERPRLTGASALSTVLPHERAEIESYLPGYGREIRWVPNPVDSTELAHSWDPDFSQPSIVYLGRFDVFHKGLDTMVEIARALPHVRVDLYGTPEAACAEAFSRLLTRAPANLRVHGPVFGRAKLDVLARSTLYLQMSRWEGFSISISEAMYLGLPCALASTMSLAGLFQSEDLGPVLPTDAGQATQTIEQAIADPARLRRWSERSRAYAHLHFEPACVAQRFVELYQRVPTR